LQRLLFVKYIWIFSLSWEHHRAEAYRICSLKTDCLHLDLNHRYFCLCSCLPAINLETFIAQKSNASFLLQSPHLSLCVYFNIHRIKIDLIKLSTITSEPCFSTRSQMGLCSSKIDTAVSMDTSLTSIWSVCNTEPTRSKAIFTQIH
jgi:hypothetical protein